MVSWIGPSHRRVLVTLDCSLLVAVATVRPSKAVCITVDKERPTNGFSGPNNAAASAPSLSFLDATASDLLGNFAGSLRSRRPSTVRFQELAKVPGFPPWVPQLVSPLPGTLRLTRMFL